MGTKCALFPGDSEIDQLFQIYKVMGTPNETVWPNVKKLPEYNPCTPKWKKKDLYIKLLTKFDKIGIDLLNKCLIYPPNQRITCKTALTHEWFDEIRYEMINKFGFKYPHCGNKSFQIKYNQNKILNKNNNINNIINKNKNIGISEDVIMKFQK